MREAGMEIEQVLASLVRAPSTWARPPTSSCWGSPLGDPGAFDDIRLVVAQAGSVVAVSVGCQWSATRYQVRCPPLTPAIDALSPSHEELELAARNHGMPSRPLRRHARRDALPADPLRHPGPDADSWRSTSAGWSRRPLALSIGGSPRAAGRHDARSRWNAPGTAARGWTRVRSPAVAATRRSARPMDGHAAPSDPGGSRARATTPSSSCSAEPTTGSQGDVEQDYEGASRSPMPCATTSCSRTSMNGQPLPPQHGFPLRLVVPGWYGMTSVKWLTADHRRRRAVRGLPDVGLPAPARARRTTGRP